jgi:hypothetical protein
MSLWREDLWNCSGEEILRIQAENSEWGRVLRSKNTCFVNSRLSNEITHSEYQSNREQLYGETCEYQRRAALLNDRFVGTAQTRAYSAALGLTLVR